MTPRVLCRFRPHVKEILFPEFEQSKWEKSQVIETPGPVERRVSRGVEVTTIVFKEDLNGTIVAVNPNDE